MEIGVTNEVSKSFVKFLGTPDQKYKRRADRSRRVSAFSQSSLRRSLAKEEVDEVKIVSDSPYTAFKQ